MKASRLYLFAAAVCIALSTGCSQQQAQNAGNQISNGITVANDKANQAVAEAKPTLEELNLGARVSTALNMNENLPRGAIRVDASPTGVRLSGTVDTLKQRALAGQIAVQTLKPNQSVDNEIKVKGK